MAICFSRAKFGYRWICFLILLSEMLFKDDVTVVLFSFKVLRNLALDIEKIMHLVYNIFVFINIATERRRGNCRFGLEMRQNV